MTNTNTNITTDNAPQDAENAAEAPEAVDDANAPQTGTEDGTDASGDDETGTGDGPSREAARYRRRLREAEAERDVLQQRVETMQRAEVERLAGDRLDRPGDMWLTGTELSELLTDDGAVDADKVNSAVDTVLTERPGWQRTTAPSFDGGARKSAESAPTWQDMLQGGQRR